MTPFRDINNMVLWKQLIATKILCKLNIYFCRFCSKIILRVLFSTLHIDPKAVKQHFLISWMKSCKNKDRLKKCRNLKSLGKVRGGEKRMKRALALLLAVMLIAGMFVGCGGQEAPATEEPATEAPETTEEPMEEALKVSMVTDVGGVNDLSFNQSAWEGLERSKAEFGTDVSYLESKQEADYEVNLETLVDEETILFGVLVS